jgi:protein required for attachment to host cells
VKPVKTWILIADGARARIFENDGPGHGISELTQHAREIDLKASRDIDADAPGRTFDSGGQGRHAMEPPTDAKKHEKQSFHAELADLLKKSLDKGAYDRVVLVAPPATLGDLRGSLDKTVLNVIHGELAKDLTKVSAHDLPGHLGEVLAV